MFKRIAIMSAALMLSGCLSTMAEPGGARSSGFDDRLGRMMAGESEVRGAALDSALERAAAYPLGSMRNPIRAQMAQGQRAYLDRLRCANGARPNYDRAGSMGDGPYGNIVDLYNLSCGADGGETASVYMDMYHRGHVESRAIDGFTIVE